MSTSPTLSDLTEQYTRHQHVRAFTDYLRVKALHLGLAAMPDSPAHDRIRKVAALPWMPGAQDPLLAISTTFTALVSEGTLLGKMTGTLPTVPRAAVVDVPADPVGGFIGPNDPIPAAMLTTRTTTASAGKIGAIYGVDRQLLLRTDSRAGAALERVFVTALRRVEDRELLSFTAAVEDERPAGLLATAPEIGGGSPSELEDAISAMFAYVSDGQPGHPYFIASPRAALWMALQRTDSGARFPNVRITGGDIAGIPLVTSTAAAHRLILVDASKIAVVDDGLAVDASEQANLQLSDTPSAGPTSTVSAFQTNTSFVRLVRYLSWTLATDDAVAYTEIGALAGSPS